MKNRLVCGLMIFALASMNSHPAETIDTGRIVASAISASCLRFQVVGICLWLVCAGPFCKVQKSIKIGHYNPDLVVSAFNGLGKNPWKEVQAILDSAEKSAASGVLSSLGGFLPNLAGGMTGGTTGSRVPVSDNLLFKEAHAFGHPLSGNIHCPSEADALNPYFVSAADAIAWRWSIPELIYPQALIPGMREIGDWPLNTWSAVYPRSGWAFQQSDFRAAAVAAQRVGDIVTRGAQIHIYQELQSGGQFVEDKKLVWRPPNPVKEGDMKTGYWQMLVPSLSQGCITFGNDRSLGRKKETISEGGDYVWTLWRPYACCKVKGAFITSIDLMPFP